MEPLTFILGIASGVLSGVLTDLITGKSKVAGKAEIEKEVAQQLLHHAHKQHLEDIKNIKRQIMDEIDIISARHPDLIVSSEAIELRHQVKKGLIKRQSVINKELTLRLSQLDDVVKERRKSLGLPTLDDRIDSGEDLRALTSPVNQDEAKTDKDKDEEIRIEWDKSENYENDSEPSKWVRELEEMDRRIAARRKGRSGDDRV